MLLRYEKVHKDKVILRPQARQHPPEYLSRLADSLIDPGQLQPIGVLVKDWSVMFGNGRVLAARMKQEITHLDAVLFDAVISKREWLRIRAVENLVRQDLSNAEKCQSCIEYAQTAPELSLKEIGKDLGGYDAGMVTRWMAYGNCIEAVRQALIAEKLTLNGMYDLSRLPQDRQAAALEAALNGKKPAKKSSGRRWRLQCEMPSGAVVTLASESDGVGLDSVIETLSDLLKSARKANDEGIDAKTWERVLRDKARS